MDLSFSGEMCIPGKSPKRIQDDHFERYYFAAPYVKDKTVLDIACGTGCGSKILIDAGAIEVHGMNFRVLR